MTKHGNPRRAWISSTPPCSDPIMAWRFYATMGGLLKSTPRRHHHAWLCVHAFPKSMRRLTLTTSAACLLTWSAGLVSRKFALDLLFLPPFALPISARFFASSANIGSSSTATQARWHCRFTRLRSRRVPLCQCWRWCWHWSNQAPNPPVLR